MTTTMDFHGWRFRIDRERTAAAYAASQRRGAEDCSCAWCRNLVVQRSGEYPHELRSFLEAVGVDPFKEAGTYAPGPLGDGYTHNEGWWHFIGEVEAMGESPIRIAAKPTGQSKNWQLYFLAGIVDEKLDELPLTPLVQVQYSVRLAWVLNEPDPYEPDPSEPDPWM